MFKTDDDTITITPKNPDSKWVAIDSDNKIIAEGIEAGEVIEKAKESKVEFTLLFIPQKGNTYLF